MGSDRNPRLEPPVAEVPLLNHACERFTDGRRNVPSDVVHHRSPIEYADLSRNNLVPRTLSPLSPFLPRQQYSRLRKPVGIDLRRRSLRRQVLLKTSVELGRVLTR